MGKENVNFLKILIQENAGNKNIFGGGGWGLPSPEGRNGNPLQYSYLENSMDRGVW